MVGKLLRTLSLGAGLLLGSVLNAQSAVYTIVCTGLTCAVDASGSANPSNISSYVWTWGDGRTDTVRVATAFHSYSASGSFSQQLMLLRAPLNDTTSKVVAVVAPVIPPPVVTIAEFPRVYLNTTSPPAPSTGRVVIAVPAGGNLQNALNMAQPGDVIELAAGAVFTGNFVLPVKPASTSWIVIRPSNWSVLPGEGIRMRPTVAALMKLPRVQTNSGNPAIGFAAGAHHWRITGIEVSLAPTLSLTYALLSTESTTGQKLLSSVPSFIVLDRVYIHGTATQTVRRCVALNSASSAVVDSWLSDCHELGSDSQAIAIWNGPGPFKIVNNYLEAAGENIMLGGNDPSIPQMTPSDIEIRRNHLFKQPSWKGIWSVKNLLEMKHAQRVLVEGNVLENSWQHAQNGVGVVMKSVNQNGSCSWCVTQDVTYRLNTLTNVGAGYNIGASPDNANPTVHARRLVLMDNIATKINTSAQFNGDGRAFLLDGDLRDVVIAHNTTLNASHGFVMGGMPSVSLTVRDNFFGARNYAVIGTNLNGGAAWTHFAPLGVFLNNVFIGDPSMTGTNYGALSSYPATTTFESGYQSANVAFASYLNNDFTLTSTSKYKGTASDRFDVGANIPAVMNAIAGVVVPP